MSIRLATVELYSIEVNLAMRGICKYIAYLVRYFHIIVVVNLFKVVIAINNREPAQRWSVGLTLTLTLTLCFMR